MIVHANTCNVRVNEEYFPHISQIPHISHIYILHESCSAIFILTQLNTLQG